MAAALALQLDIWSSGFTSRDTGYNNFEIVPGGSTLEISEGRGGTNVLQFFNSNRTEIVQNKGELACQIVKRPFQPTGDIDAAKAVSAVAARMADRRAERLRKGINHARAQVIVLVINY